MATQKNIVGTPIRRIRKTRLLSQDALSEMIGIDPKSLGRIENGLYHPSLDTLVKIAQALDVPIRELFPEQGEGSTKSSTAIKDIRHALVDYIYSADERELIGMHKKYLK